MIVKIKSIFFMYFILTIVEKQSNTINLNNKFDVKT